MASVISLLINLAAEAKRQGNNARSHELEHAAEECRAVMAAAFDCTDNCTPNPADADSYCVPVAMFDRLNAASARLGGVR